jgi:hypothetical protein
MIRRIGRRPGFRLDAAPSQDTSESSRRPFRVAAQREPASESPELITLSTIPSDQRPGTTQQLRIIRGQIN